MMGRSPSCARQRVLGVSITASATVGYFGVHARLLLEGLGPRLAGAGRANAMIQAGLGAGQPHALRAGRACDLCPPVDLSPSPTQPTGATRTLCEPLGLETRAAAPRVSFRLS